MIVSEHTGVLCLLLVALTIDCEVALRRPFLCVCVWWGGGGGGRGGGGRGEAHVQKG